MIQPPPRARWATWVRAHGAMVAVAACSTGCASILGLDPGEKGDPPSGERGDASKAGNPFPEEPGEAPPDASPGGETGFADARVDDVGQPGDAPGDGDDAASSDGGDGGDGSVSPDASPDGMPDAADAMGDADDADDADAADASPPCPLGMSAVGGGTYRLGERGSYATVAPFCMDKSEVTTRAFTSCVTAGKCTSDGLKVYPECNYGRASRDDHPINCAAYAQAMAYCAWVGGRLPSEEEWEWAARGESKARPYPWGSEAPKYQLCWSGVVFLPRFGTCTVGGFIGGDDVHGIHDLSGNVWELTTTRVVDGSGENHIVRGGSWYNTGSRTMTVWHRDWVRTTFHARTVGFRCVRGRSP